MQAATYLINTDDEVIEILWSRPVGDYYYILNLNAGLIFDQTSLQIFLNPLL